MNILFITNLLPYPLDNGGKIKTYNVLRVLSEKNKVDMICFHENKEDLKYINNLKSLINEIYAFNKKLTTRKNKNKMILKALYSLFSKYPYSIYKYKEKCVSQKIKEIKSNYDYIYIDHLQLAVYINDLQGFKGKIILDQHNCESLIIKRYCDKENNIFKKIFLNIEYIKLKRFEVEILKKVDKIITLSEEDKREMIQISKVDNEKFDVIPIIVDNDFEKNINNIKLNDRIKVMFLGTLTWYPNIQGIKWFLKNVFDKVSDKIDLYIVGKDPDSELVEMIKEFKNITLTGYVDDVNDYFEICDIMIVPLFIGSGLRVKILEALAKGMPVISTQIGCEGINVTNGEDILIANTPEEFIEKINDIRDINQYKHISLNGKKLYNYNYSFEALNKKINESIDFS